MPVVRNYKPGSIIYFEGDKAEEIYILQSGKVVLIYQTPDTNEEVTEPIANGEFFGVKSVLGKYPREETAQVVTSSVVLALTPAEFEQMVIKNFKVLLKMLKVFSNQLRRIGRKVRERLEKSEPKMPSTELFNIGEYYFKKGKVESAKYVYTKYIQHYPEGEFVEKCKERLSAIDRGDFKVAVEPVLQAQPETPVAIEAQPELEETPEEKTKPVKSVPEGVDITKKFYEALSLFSQDKFEEAINIYNEILEIKMFKDEATAQFAEKSQFELARCFMKLEKYKEAIDTLSNLIKRFPKTKLLKDALFQIGECYSKMNNYQKAINFYQKVVNLPPKETINSQAKKAIEELQNKL